MALTTDQERAGTRENLNISKLLKLLSQKNLDLLTGVLVDGRKDDLEALRVMAEHLKQTPGLEKS